MEVAIMGKGFVGTATKYFLEEYCKDTVSKIHVEDPGYNLYISDHDWESVKYTFICVPTDNDGVNNDLNLTILMKALQRAKGIPVIRSTVGPDSLITLAMACNHDIPLMHWPEFLREKHWKADVDNKDIPVVIGGKEDMTNTFVNSILPQDRTIVESSVREAALMKISRNAMLAAKVAQFNMLYDLCKEHKCSYELIKVFFKLDGTLGDTHMDVPGHDGDRGFGGKCLPKDTKHYEQLFTDHNMYSEVLDYNSTFNKCNKYSC